MACGKACTEVIMQTSFRGVDSALRRPLVINISPCYRMSGLVRILSRTTDVFLK